MPTMGFHALRVAILDLGPPSRPGVKLRSAGTIGTLLLRPVEGEDIADRR